MIFINVKVGVLFDSVILKVYEIVGFYGIILIELLKKKMMLWIN